MRNLLLLTICLTGCGAPFEVEGGQATESIGTPGFVGTGAYLKSPIQETPSGQRWIWAATVLMRQAPGALVESDPFIIRSVSSASSPPTDLSPIPERVLLSQASPATVVLPADGLATAARLQSICLKLYRGEGGRLGLVAQVRPDSGFFVDTGATPNYSLPPPTPGSTRGRYPDWSCDFTTP